LNSGELHQLCNMRNLDTAEGLNNTQKILLQKGIVEGVQVIIDNRIVS
jgi:hypothetical protein